MHRSLVAWSGPNYDSIMLLAFNGGQAFKRCGKCLNNAVGSIFRDPLAVHSIVPWSICGLGGDAHGVLLP